MYLRRKAQELDSEGRQKIVFHDYARGMGLDENEVFGEKIKKQVHFFYRGEWSIAS
jgi:hypothetical protein